jgi:hypothetical protein
MNIKQTKFIIKNSPNKSIMLHAKHGVGKSSVVKQSAQELSQETGNSYGFYDVRLSQCEVGDIKGLPYQEQDENGNTIVKFSKPEWFPQDPNSSGILFFDELNRASKDVLQAVFEICLDRRLDGVSLPDGWKIVSAVNSDDEYDVVELDPALHDRWFHIDFDPSVEEWLDWAEDNNIHSSITQFVSRNHNLLDPPVGNLESGKVYPSRRSWQSFSQFLVEMELLKDDGMLTQVAKGWLGREIAIMFQKFVTNEFSQLKAEDVLDNFSKYKKDIEKTCCDIEVIAVLSKSVVKEANARSAKDLKDKQKNNLKQFFLMLPSDVASDVWVGLLRGSKTKRFVMEWQSDTAFEEKLKEVYLA